MSEENIKSPNPKALVDSRRALKTRLTTLVQMVDHRTSCLFIFRKEDAVSGGRKLRWVAERAALKVAIDAYCELHKFARPTYANNVDVRNGGKS